MELQVFINIRFRSTVKQNSGKSLLLLGENPEDIIDCTRKGLLVMWKERIWSERLAVAPKCTDINSRSFSFFIQDIKFTKSITKCG